MAGTESRLGRLLADQSGECCDADVDAHLSELRDLDEATPAPAEDVATLAALAGETRYRIVRLLAAGGERCVCEFTPLLDVSESAVSHALSDLTDAGLVARRKEGRWRYYRTTGRAEALLEALDATRGA